MFSDPPWKHGGLFFLIHISQTYLWNSSFHSRRKVMATTKSNSSSSTNSGSKTTSTSQSASTSQTASSSQSWGGSSSDTTSHTTGGSHSESYTNGGSHSETYGTNGSTSQTQGGSQSNTSGKSWASGTVDETTLANKDKYSQSYQQSQQVQDTYSRLQDTLNNKPGAFSSSYSDKLNDLYNQISGRDPFKYNFNADPMYRMYAQQYQQQGKQAMQDTMGQAAALTGGYASSYAQTAGQQSYQSYLQQLNDIIPELRNQAYQEWQAEGESLKDLYNLTQNAYDNEYQQYRDKVSDWQQDRSFDQSDYQQERNFDYSQYSADRAYWNQEFWNQKNSEQSSMSGTDSTNWSNSQQQGWSQSKTDSTNWSHTSTDTSSWSDTSSHTDSTNWSNSLSNSATAQNSVSNSAQDTTSWSTTNSSSSSTGSGSGSSSSTKTAATGTIASSGSRTSYGATSADGNHLSTDDMDRLASMSQSQREDTLANWAATGKNSYELAMVANKYNIDTESTAFENKVDAVVSANNKGNKKTTAKTTSK